MKFFLAIILIFCSQYKASAQQNESELLRENSEVVLIHDSLYSFPSHLYYKKILSLEHDYDYEKTNKLKSLKLKKAELQAATGLVCLVSMYGVSFLLTDSNNDLSLLWAIPTGMAVATGEYILFSRYIKNVQKEIDIIQSSSVYSYNINHKIKIDAVHFSNRSDIVQHSFGVSLKINL